MSHMLKYHVAVPIGIFLVLIVIGVPIGTALVVGMMSGCMAMMFMMMGHGSDQDSGHAGHERDRREDRQPH